MRRIAGVFTQFGKARLVLKLRGARERQRAIGSKVEERKSYAEARPEVVARAKRLGRKSPKAGGGRCERLPTSSPGQVTPRASSRKSIAAARRNRQSTPWRSGSYEAEAHPCK